MQPGLMIMRLPLKPDRVRDGRAARRFPYRFLRHRHKAARLVDIVRGARAQTIFVSNTRSPESSKCTSTMTRAAGWQVGFSSRPHPDGRRCVSPRAGEKRGKCTLVDFRTTFEHFAQKHQGPLTRPLMFHCSFRMRSINLEQSGYANPNPYR